MLDPVLCFHFRASAEQYLKPNRARHFVSTEIS